MRRDFQAGMKNKFFIDHKNKEIDLLIFLSILIL